MKIHLKKAISHWKGLLLLSAKGALITLLFASCGSDDTNNGLVIAEEFSVTVEEGLQNGTVFGSVDVTNLTGQNLTFIIESQTPSGAITIDESTGAIAVADAQLFAENQSPINAIYSAIAEDGERDASSITITVIPIDPNKDRTSFITTWRVTVANEAITIPTFPGLTYNYSVNWGDGNFSGNQTGSATHVYTTAGVYEVSISGDFPAIYFNFGSQRDKILTIEQWGNIEWETMQDAFEGCRNLTYNATDVPNLSSVTNMNGMFSSANQFNGFIGNWDVSNVTSMSRTFRSANSFNENIGAWNVSSVQNMQNMFENASTFNKPIGEWNVANVTTMSDMFEGARAFNQPIGEWNVSNVTSMADMFEDATSFNQPLNNWVVSSVRNMREMFDNAASFNQPLNSWNVGAVTDMSRMFERASSFNQPLASWNVSSVTRMWRMFINARAFNQDLSGWSVGSVTFCSTFGTNSALTAGNFPNFTSCTP